MTRPDLFRIIAGVVVMLIGLALGAASNQLWNGAPASWPDVVASADTVRSLARVLRVVSVLLAASGAAASFNKEWGPLVAAVATVVVVLGAFWANVVLFGNMRVTHTLPNLFVAAGILWLLWAGRAK